MTSSPAADEAAYRRAAEMLADADAIAVVGHLRPDADAIGSVMALTLAMRQLGKRVTPMIGQPYPVAPNLLTIPGAGEILLGEEIPDVDLVVTVDCGSIDRTGVLTDEVAAYRDRLLVIDHHISNPGYGAHNLVDVRESTTSVLRELFHYLGVELDESIAHALYAGLVTDTGSFRWGSPAMHTLAAELMGYGIDIREIAEELLDKTSPADLSMIGRALANIRLLPAGDRTVAVIMASHEDIRTHSGAAVERLIDFVRSLDGCDVGVVFKEQYDGGWATSLRSTAINVADLARNLGGGGHAQAAGYTVYGEAEDVVNQLLESVAEIRGEAGES